MTHMTHKESTCNVGDLGLNLGFEDPLEKGMATHSSILTWRTPMDCSLSVHGVAKRWTRWSNQAQQGTVYQYGWNSTP